jgi:uncharacterized protein involved in exopolysaccharide biosynthesis
LVQISKQYINTIEDGVRVEQTIDLNSIIRIIKKRYKLIFFVFLFSVLLMVLVNLKSSPVYEASATLRITQKQGLGNSLLSEFSGASSFMTKELMATYAEMLTSRSVVQTMIDKSWSPVRLDEKKPVYSSYVGLITTTPVRDTQILKVSVRGGSPEEAKLRTNVLITAFIDRLAMLSQEDQKTVRKFIGVRLNEIQRELDKAEAILTAYKTDNKIVSPSDEAKALLEAVVNLDRIDAENEVKTISAQAQLDTANAQLASEAPGFVASSQLIEQYKSKIADLEVQKTMLMQQYTAKHPQVIGVQAALDELKKNLKIEANNIATSNAPSANPVHVGLVQAKILAESTVEAGRAQKNAIKRESESRLKKLGMMPGKESKLIQLMRDAKVTEQMYLMMSQRYEEARINEVMTPRDVRIVDEAVAPDNYIAPKEKFNLLVGAIIGLIVAFFLAFTLEYFNRTIRNSDDVEHFLKLPVLGQIPDYSVKQRNFYGRMNKSKHGREYSNRL